MICISCGAPIDEGESVCKGCSRLSPEIRDELLAMSEKTDDAVNSECSKAAGD